MERIKKAQLEHELDELKRYYEQNQLNFDYAKSAAKAHAHINRKVAMLAEDIIRCLNDINENEHSHVAIPSQ